MIPRKYMIFISVLIVAEFAMSWAVYPRLPNPCPIHWNLRGEPDNFGSPLIMVLGFPSIGILLAVLLSVLPLLGPFRSNFESFRDIYGRICAGLFVCFFGIQAVLLAAAAGLGVRIGPGITIVIGAMLAMLGNWFGKIRRNMYVGIRTPWTIANDVVWEKTHRLGGRLFVAVGLVSVVTGVFAREIACAIVLLGGIGAVAFWSILYSLYCYRKLGSADELP